MVRFGLRVWLSRLLIKAWPFSFAHVRLMAFINPPTLNVDRITTNLKNFPVRINYNPNSYIGRYIYYRGSFEEEILIKMRELLRPGMTFLDVGANIGLHTIVASHCVREAGNVISIEPQKEVFKQLVKNIELNNFENVTQLNCALGKEKSEMRLFHVNEQNSGMATLAPERDGVTHNYEIVEVNRLSDVISDLKIGYIDAVKIDVEGAEFEVLKGAEPIFRLHWPSFMLIECIDEHLKKFSSSSEMLIGYLREANYKVYALRLGCWKEIMDDVNLNDDILAVQQKTL